MADPNNIHPDAPRHKSPVLWMGLLMLVLVVLTVISMWGKEKVSIKATPKIPMLTEQAKNGRVVMNAKCAECHGVDGTGGSRKGPPIMHAMYRDEVFPDFQFKRSVLEGKREKNWRFGAMPAMPEMSESDVDDIIAFVREVQFANNVE